MRMRVTDAGITIPKALLPGLDEVEIRRQDGGVLIAPIAAVESSEDDDDDDNYPVIADDDPIYNFGKNPIDIGLTDAAANHDKYLY